MPLLLHCTNSMRAAAAAAAAGQLPWCCCSWLTVSLATHLCFALLCQFAEGLEYSLVHGICHRQGAEAGSSGKQESSTPGAAECMLVVLLCVGLCIYKEACLPPRWYVAWVEQRQLKKYNNRLAVHSSICIPVQLMLLPGVQLLLVTQLCQTWARLLGYSYLTDFGEAALPVGMATAWMLSYFPCSAACITVLAGFRLMLYLRSRSSTSCSA